MNNCIVLLSGGLDSMLTLKHALEKYNNVEALFIDYGQPAKKQELIAAGKIASFFNVPLLEMKFDQIGQNMNRAKGSNVIENRNYLFIERASMLSCCVAIGCNLNDYDQYIDCRRETINEYEKQLDISIFSPVIYLSKKQIIKQAYHYNLPIDFTFSCYDPIAGKACGICNSCKEFNDAF